MAAIVLHGPEALEAARAFVKRKGWAAWSLEPDVPEAVRLEVPNVETPQEACTMVNLAEHDWLPKDGWYARLMAPVEDPDCQSGGGIQGTPL